MNSRRLVAIVLAICPCIVLAQIFPTTQLALNSNGSLLAIGYVDENKKEVVDIASLTEVPRVRTRRVAMNSIQAYTFSFGVDPESLLITTRWQNSFDLLRVGITDVRHPRIETIYSSPTLLRFPAEVAPNKLVVLQQIDNLNGNSRWRILDGSSSPQVVGRVFNRSAPPSVVGSSAFVTIASTPPQLFSIVGDVPNSVSDFFGKLDGYLVCADVPNLVTCVRSELTVLPTESYSRLVINRGGILCKSDDEWFDLRELVVARNGRYISFHAIPRGTKQRGIYLIDTSSDRCIPQRVYINREQ